MLQSCQDYPIDLIIAIDGRYKGYPAKTKYSSKEVLDLFKTENKLPYKLINKHPDDLDQQAKRNIYFDYCEQAKMDCLIVMDSDEYFINEKTDWDLFIQDLSQKITDNAHTYKQAYCIPMTLGDKGVQRMPEGYTENLPRLFHRPYELSYIDDHFSIRNKKTGILMTFDGNVTLSHIAMAHDHSLRPDEYTINTAIYEDNLIIEENNTREQKRNDFVRTIQSTK